MRGADLTDAYGLTKEQLEKAKTDDRTKRPKKYLVPVKLVSVIDAYTLSTEWNGKQKRIRLFGFDPPVGDIIKEEDKSLIEQRARKAKKYVENLIAPNSIVYLELVYQPLDSANSVSAYVYPKTHWELTLSPGHRFESLNERIFRAGYGIPKLGSTDRYYKQISEAHRYALMNRLGLFGEDQLSIR